MLSAAGKETWPMANSRVRKMNERLRRIMSLKGINRLDMRQITDAGSAT